jgi:hypothetical protein
MGKIKLSLHHMPIPGKVQFVRQILGAMTGNANFPTPEPPLADVSTAVNALEEAYNTANAARQNAVSLTSAMQDEEQSLDKLVMKLANYVENKSDGDEAKILSTGMSVKGKLVPIGDLPAPENLSAVAGDGEGKAELSWKPVRGASSYPVSKCEDPITPDGWELVGISTKANFTVKNLTSGKKCWFKVAAVGAAGQGPWSDPATVYAP